MPSRSLFITGAVGSFLAAGAALPFALFSAFGLGFFFFSFSGSGSIIAIGASSLMSVGLVLHLVGMYGFWRNYGSRLGLAAFIYGLVAIGVFLSIFFSVVLAPFSGLVFYLIGGVVLIGVLFIVNGTAYIVNRHFVMPGASIAAGVLFIVAGGFYCSFLMGFVGGILAMPALIIGGIVLVNAPLPMVFAPQPDYGPGGPAPPMPP